MSDLILPPPARSDLGAPNVRTSTSHKVYHWKSLAFFAEDGRVKVVDERTGSMSSCSRKEFILRALSTSQAIRKMGYHDEKSSHLDLLDKMTACCRDAGEQGDPHDARQLADKLKGGGRASVAVGPAAYPDRTPRYADGTPCFRPGDAGTLLLPTAGPRAN